MPEYFWNIYYEIDMEKSPKEKSKTAQKKLFAFLRASAKLEEKIDVASKILFQYRDNEKSNSLKIISNVNQRFIK